MMIAIMQPTYLPWVGYFDLIRSVDAFVFLDDVPMAQQRPNWQKENRILVDGQPRWLRLPTLRPRGDATLINQMTIKKTDWALQHCALLAQGYEYADGYARYAGEFEQLVKENSENLCALNISLICWMMGAFGLNTKTVLSSDLPVSTARKDAKIIEICKSLGAQKYFSPSGAKDYCKEESFEREGLELIFQNYTPKQYPQAGADFVSHLSAIDLIFRHPLTCGNYL
ncbi:WbqC family protein [Ruegeria conchae]|uniref:WbqC family protein n=1 Tax=Ruegeria conchae TaxID=981384 RepID=UPI0029C62200|nr:WbqC family protein [Ruegeria conchae]